MLFWGFGGGPLPFGFRCFETPSLCGFPLLLLFLIPDLFAACFDLTVDVLEGAIVVLWCWLCEMVGLVVTIKDRGNISGRCGR